MTAQPVRYRVWVGGLPRDVRQDELYAKFSKYGNIQDITIRHSDSDTYSFITYTERHDAEEAIARMDRSCAWGAPVKVNISKDFPPNGPRQRGFDGKPINVLPAVSDSPEGHSPRHSPLPARQRLRSRTRRRCHARKNSRSDSRQHNFRCDSRRPHRSFTERSKYRRPQVVLEEPVTKRYFKLQTRDGEDVCEPGRRSSATHGASERQLPSPLRGYVPFASCDTELRAPLPLPRQSRTATIVGRHRITIEHIPEDMNWLELKDLGLGFGSSVTFSRTYRRGSSSFGMLEYSDPRDARRCAEELDGRRMEDGKAAMRIHEGDLWNS